MSEAASDLLAKMRGEGSVKVEPDGFYVKLLVNQTRRRRLTLAVVLFYVLAFVVLFNDLPTDKHWFFTALPIIGVGIMIMFIPATEEWSYRPWQTQARQYEKHQAAR